ncbi:MAG: hypothetical protein H6719_34555 [Sandaracinaceae bacterium]|nr:hypothetical protein [Sandaracinaceae bacterium]
MRLIVRLSLAIAAALALNACGARQNVELASGEPLRLTRIVMYQNGLAHFERRGHAEGRSVDLAVPATQVDDVLRSLTVVDGADAAITGVRMMPATTGEDVTLRIGLVGEGARDLRISYVTELPGFRPTYRLVVHDDAVHVQGLAVVDNPTSESWSDVGLTLSTEVPLSFRFDVRTARTANRPAFGPDGHLIRTELGNQLTNVFHSNAAPTGAGEINAAYGRAQAGQPEMSNRAGRLVGEAPEGDDGAPDAPSNGGASNALLAFEQRPASAEGAFAEMHGFHLGGHESGLVPFVDTRTSGRMALVFKPSQGGALSAEHPYRAVLFRNPSDASLMTGPVSIFSGDRFVGDGVTATVAAGAHAFVPYALERSVHVTQNTEQVEDEVRGTQLNGGVLTVELRAVARDRFDVTTTQPLAHPLYVYAPLLEGFEPRELPAGAIQTPQGYFLPATPSERGDATVVFDQVRRRSVRVNLASDPDHAYVPALLRLLDGRPEVARLREIANRLVAIAEELDTHAEDLNVERAALVERRDALEALRGVSGGDDVRQRLSRGVAENVARVDALARRASELHAEQIGLEQEWYARLRAMDDTSP